MGGLEAIKEKEMASITIDTFVELHGVVKRVILIADDEENYYALDIEFQTALVQITLINDTFQNARMLSAELVADLGLRSAIDLLEASNVPRTHPLWDLNHSNLWET